MERIFKKENQNKLIQNKSKDFLETIKHLEEQDLPDLFIIDLDGVLIDPSLGKIFRGLIFYLFDKKKFEEYTQKHKIPFSYLRKLVKLAQKTQIVILTNRFLKEENDILKNVFPFISPELIEKFKNKFNIKIIGQAFKPIIKDEVKELVANNNKIVYLGSSLIDKITANRLKKINPNISFLQIKRLGFI